MLIAIVPALFFVLGLIGVITTPEYTFATIVVVINGLGIIAMCIGAKYDANQKKEPVVDYPVPTVKNPIVMAAILKPKGFHGIHDVMDHIVGDGYTVYYGEFEGYSCGITDSRTAMIVAGYGYTYRGTHLYGADSWFMFAS